MVEQIRSTFINKFGDQPSVMVRSPGRINLIGEHTDYNGGFVLPAAINKNIFLALGRREDNEIHLHAFNLDDFYSCRVGEFNKSDKKWPDYIVGVIGQLKKRNIAIPGFNCVFGGDIPIGAGLSSSAALESGIIYGLCKLFDINFSPLDIALAAQAAENEFVGMQCGIMDQFACVFGKANHLIKLDCRSLEFEYIPFHSEEYNIILCDSGVKHSLTRSNYNLRRNECEAGVRILNARYPDIHSLRDANEEQLDSVEMPGDIYKRCKYVIDEIERVQEGCKDMKRNDIVSFGERMLETHLGLELVYEVSCKEIDYLVDLAIEDDSAIGARMMGGGFGGCTINLVKKEDANDFLSKVKFYYNAAYKKEPECYIVEITDGVGLI